MAVITPTFLDSKTTAEVIPVVFPFGNIVDSIDSVISVDVTTISGEDASPNALKNGAAIISGVLVIQTIQGGVDGAVYLINCTIARGIERYSMACYLPVADYK